MLNYPDRSLGVALTGWFVGSTNAFMLPFGRTDCAVWPDCAHWCLQKRVTRSVPTPLLPSIANDPRIHANDPRIHANVLTIGGVS